MKKRGDRIPGMVFSTEQQSRTARARRPGEEVTGDEAAEIASYQIIEWKYAGFCVFICLLFFL